MVSLFTQRIFVDPRRKDGGFTAPVEPSSPTPLALQRREPCFICSSIALIPLAVIHNHNVTRQDR